MDYLDPKKEFRHRIILYIGYIFIGFGIVIATMVLVYQAYGFGLNRDGGVVQNGLLFISSKPNPAVITLNGKKAASETNARIVLPSNIYNVTLNRNGYREWKRTIDINGSRILHVDYPILIPTTLKPTLFDTFATKPSFATQSTDRRWYMLQTTESLNVFTVFDLRATTNVSSTVTLPDTLLTKSSDAQAWEFVAWADDNQHVLLRHIYGGQSEYVIIDREAPEQSVNLTTTFNAAGLQFSLLNRKYDRYYGFNPSAATVASYQLNNPTPQSVLDHVLAFKSYSDDQLLYATDLDAPAGKVYIKQLIGNQNTTLRTFPAGTTYLLDFTKYSGVQYVVMGASSENKVYIYRDPVGQLKSQPKHAIVPTQVLHVTTPDYLSFSPNAQFIIVEHQNQFGVYDIENQVGYNYSLTLSLPKEQSHLSWMDGSHLTGVSDGKIILVDYDGTNLQTLVPSEGAFIPAYSTNFKSVYSIVNGSTNSMNKTPLVVPGD